MRSALLTILFGAVALFGQSDRGTITGTIELGNHLPRALIPAGSGLWVIATDGTALLVQP